MTNEADFPLDNELCFLRELWALNHAMESASKRMETVLGVTARQRIIIRILGRYPAMTAGQLALLLRVDPGTLSVAVSRLEARGYVARRRDTRDQRRTILMLTSKGRSLDVPSSHSIENAVQRVLLKTSARERDVVSGFIRRLVEHLDHTAGTPSEPSLHR